MNQIQTSCLKTEIKVTFGFVMALFASVAQATATLDCAAPPYYLSLIVSLEHGARSFSFYRETELLASGDINSLKSFELKWPNPNGISGNILRIENRFSASLEISGQAKDDTGTLQVNDKYYKFKCDWKM